MSNPNYASVRNACAILEALSSAVPQGMTNKDIASAAGITPAQVTRLTAPLMEIGWVKKLPDGNYCLCARVGALAVKMMSSFDAAEQRLADAKHNYLPLPEFRRRELMNQYTNPNN